MEKNWNTQTIVITGAASGLGKAIATRFVQLGAKVLGLDQNENDLATFQKR